MTIDITVPALGESITEATVMRWLKTPGEPIALDEPIVELETDKIAVEVNAAAAGTLADIVAGEGENVAVGAVLGHIERGAGAGPSPPGPESPAPEPEPRVAPEPAAKPAQPLSPAVRKLIEQHGLDPAQITGTGKDGRLLKSDVLAVIEPAPAPVSPDEPPVSPHAASAAAPPAPPPVAPPAIGRDEEEREERVPMTRLRRRVAERLKLAQDTAAILTTFNEVDMSKVIAARAEHRDAFEKKHGVRLGFMSFFVKAVIVALRELRSVNAAIDGEDIVYKNYFHIGIAVSAPQGLVVPVVRDADRLSFAGIEKAINTLGTKARDTKLTMDDLVGGTFTISNGGVFGSLMSTPILNPPQSAILGMHKIQDRPVAIAGQVEIRPMMYLALSYDHRLIDGREAVTFLVRIKDCIEDPQRILLDL